MKKISIIVPAYNAEKYIEECIQSIVKELDESCELIIIDDGSKDNTSNICKKYISNNIRLISNTNHGVSYSRNMGIEESSGEYIMFVDADDLLTIGWKTNIFNAIEKKCDVCFFSESFNSVYDNDVSKEKIIDCIFGIDKSLKWLSTPWSKIFKKEFLNNNKIRFIKDIINGEDMLFNASVILNSNSYTFVNKNIYNFRINNLSVTKTFNEKIFDSDISFQNNLKSIFLNDNEMMGKYSKYCVRNAILLFLKKMSILNLSNAKKYYYIFGKEPYHTYIMSKDKKTSLKNRIILFLIRKNMYDVDIMLMKSKNLLTFKRQDDYIIKI